MSRILRLSDIAPRDINWLWKPYIALGKVTCLEGDPGIGKSWLLAALAANLSIGLLPDGTPAACGPQSTIIANAEDDIADTIRPRVGAFTPVDLDRIHMFATAPCYDTRGARIIGAAVTDLKPTLVTIDPLAGYLGATINMNQANHTRKVLTELKDIAEKHNCAIVIARHLSKANNDNIKYRGQGSIDITGACRSVLLAGSTGDGISCGVAHIKSNGARLGKSFAYQILDDDHAGRFVWSGYNDSTAGDLTNAGLKIDDAKAYLLMSLSSGPRAATDIQNNSVAYNISPMTLRRAADLLGVEKRQIGRQWLWVLPDSTTM